MRQLFFTVLLAALPLINVEAEPWSFKEAVPVTPVLQSRVFHHLDSSGRRNIAATDRGVAVAWEDDRDGTPRVYLAYKAYDEQSFTKELQVSGPGEAFEPSLIAMSDGRFAIAWEEDGEIWSRLIRIEGETERGIRQKISRHHGAQATLVNDGEKGVVLWSEREGRFGRIRGRRFNAQGLKLIPESGCPIDATPAADEQLYPAASVIRGRLVVAWDDEREGDSDLMLSWYQDGEWSDDWPVPVASGEGWQSSPTLVIDNKGNLHAAWIERDEIGGSSRLKYAFGRLEGD